MISTRVFARQRSIWATLTPTLEQVVRWINDNAEDVAPGVPATGGEPANNAVIAEAAFALVASGRPWSGPTNEELATVREYVAALEVDSLGTVSLDEDELTEVDLLAHNLQRMVASVGIVHYWPAVPGCGVVDAGHADIVDRATAALFEVKSVSRPFRSGDLRQLLTYCAMFAASGFDVDEVGLVNPRLGRMVRVSLDFVCQGGSGLSRGELLREIQRRMADIAVSA